MKGVSTLIAAVFILFIFVAFSAAILLIIEYWNNLVVDSVEKLSFTAERNAEELTISNISVLSGSIIIGVRNTGSTPVHLVRYYVRDLNTNSVTHGLIDYYLPVSSSTYVKISGSYDSNSNYLIILVSSRDKAYKTKYPLPQPPTTSINVTYSITYAPNIISGYTTAALGYNSTTAPPTPPTQYSVKSGSLLSGDITSLQTKNDGNYLIIESAYKSGGYVTPITITNNVDQDLIDYQVNITLTRANWDGWNEISRDCSDIYFTDSTGRPLFFWIEYNNTPYVPGRDMIIVWVKVPLIPAGGTTTIYMHYGLLPNPYSSYNDPKNTFFIYEDFTSSPSGSLAWTAIYLQSDQLVMLTEPVNNQLGYLYYNKVPTNPTGFYARFYFAAGYGSGADAVWLGAYDTSYAGTREDIVNGGYHFTFDEYQDRIAFTKSTTDNGPSIAQVTVAGIDNGVTHLAEIYFWYDPVQDVANTIISYDGATVLKASDLVVQANVKNGVGQMIIGGRTGGLNNYHNLSTQLLVAKYVNPHPSVTISPSTSVNYVMSLILGWSGLTPATVVELLLNGALNITSYQIEIFENSSGTWQSFYSGTNTIPQKVSINKYFSSGSIGIMINITSSDPFELSLDYAAISTRQLDTAAPLLAITSNSSDQLLIYNPNTDKWTIVKVSGPLINQNVFFDYLNMTFLILNETNILRYDPYVGTVSSATALPGSDKAKDAAFLIPMEGYVIYAPGGGSQTVYVYNESTWTILNVETLPEPVNPFTCVAYDPNSKTAYIMYGGTGNLYSIKVDPGGALTISQVGLDPAPPTAYPVGAAYGDGYIWIISKAGGVSYVNPSTGEVIPLTMQPPYYPISEGDRLGYYTGSAGQKYLIHVREDGTSEVWIINVS